MSRLFAALLKRDLARLLGTGQGGGAVLPILFSSPWR